MQLPWLEQADHGDHSAVSLSHVRDCPPQLPQVWLIGPLHTCPVQVVFQRQLLAHVCVPPAPQLRVASGAQAPWFMHADQSPQSPVLLSQVRVCVPQLPQARLAAPWQT